MRWPSGSGSMARGRAACSKGSRSTKTSPRAGRRRQQARKVPWRPWSRTDRMTKIGVCGSALTQGLKATFNAVGEVFDLSIEERRLDDGDDIDGWIVLGADRPGVAQ